MVEAPARGPEAYVVETELRATSGAQIGDLKPIMSLAIVAWCGEHEIYTREEPIPDLMVACGLEGRYLANIHPEPWRNAVREVLPSKSAGRQERRAAVENRSHTYVKMHLEGSSVEPWSVPDSACVFGTANTTDPEGAELSHYP